MYSTVRKVKSTELSHAVVKHVPSKDNSKSPHLSYLNIGGKIRVHYPCLFHIRKWHSHNRELIDNCGVMSNELIHEIHSVHMHAHTYTHLHEHTGLLTHPQVRMRTDISTRTHNYTHARAHSLTRTQCDLQSIWQTLL